MVPLQQSPANANSVQQVCAAEHLHHPSMQPEEALFLTDLLGKKNSLLILGNVLQKEDVSYDVVRWMKSFVVFEWFMSFVILFKREMLSPFCYVC